MKLNNILSNLLELVGFAIGFIGVVFMIGTVGTYELDNITDYQFFIRELQSFGTILLAVFICRLSNKTYKY